MEMGMEALEKKPNPFTRGQVNHVSVEEIEEQPNAVVCKFLINAFTTLVLFDAGASHSFISRGFVDKFKWPPSNGASSNQNRPNPAAATKDLSHVTCYKCGKTGNYANDCSELKNRNGNGNSGKKPNPFTGGQVNHINVEVVEDQPDAVIGKFLIKSFTTLVLFDTSASHSYISRGFVDKFKWPTLALRSPMLVSSRGAE